MWSGLSNIYNEIIYKIPNNGIEPNLKSLGDITYIEITPEDSKGVILVSHGTNTDIVTQAENCRELSKDVNMTVVLYDYPGFGASKGEANEETCTEALGCLMWEYRKYPLLLVGQSLGVV